MGRLMGGARHVSPRDVLLLVLVVFAPWVLVLIIAMLRGYDITVIFRRDKRPPP